MRSGRNVTGSHRPSKWHNEDGTGLLNSFIVTLAEEGYERLQVTTRRIVSFSLTSVSAVINVTKGPMPPAEFEFDPSANEGNFLLMEQDTIAAPPPPPPAIPAPPIPLFGPPPKPTVWQKFKKLLGPLAAAGVLLLKFGAKVKFLIVPFLKFFPLILKTGGTMVLSIAAYAMMWGVWFAVGFVLLIFVHELGHLLAARKCGLKVGAPVFIPFMGAFIALKEAPRDAWIEAQVGIGGPMLGALGAAICEMIHLATGNPLFRALAYTGFFLNLFNLAPVGFLDGGRIVTALSPWLWLVGFVIVGVMMFLHPNFILLLILVFSAPRVFSLFRRKTAEEARYFEVTPAQRWTMAIMYFGLIGLLVLGMRLSHIPREAL